MTDEIEIPVGMSPERWAEYKAAIDAATKINDFDWFWPRSLIGDVGLIRSSEDEKMEERMRYSTFGEGLMAGIVSPKRQEYTFTVTLPNSDRREVEATYMEIDGSTLYFQDESRETILAYGPGHWVWAERLDTEAE